MRNFNSDEVCIQNIRELFAFFGLRYVTGKNRVVMPCPIHGGDNPNGCTLFLDSPYNWKCWTHKCETSGKTISNFFRILLEKKLDKKISYESFCLWIENKFGGIVKSEGSLQVSSFDSLFRKRENKKSGISRKLVVSKKNIPQQMIDKGYSAAILDKYDVFLCKTPRKAMTNRIVVPIYDESHTFMLGCTGRSIFDRCDKCRLYHDKNERCPSSSLAKLKSSKWRHSKGLVTSDCFYNIWYAKPYIEKYNAVILVESPGNVWKLEQNRIHNSMAVFGSSLSYGQSEILESMSIKDVYLVFDNDEAGKIGTEKIMSSLGRLYNIYIPDIDYENKNDISELPDNSQFFSDFSRKFA